MSNSKSSYKLYVLGALIIFVSSLFFGAGASEIMGLSDMGYILAVAVFSLSFAILYSMVTRRLSMTDFSRTSGLTGLFFASLIVLDLIGMLVGWMVFSESGSRNNFEVLDQLYPAFLLMAACVGPAMLGLLSSDPVADQVA